MITETYKLEHTIRKLREANRRLQEAADARIAELEEEVREAQAYCEVAEQGAGRIAELEQAILDYGAGHSEFCDWGYAWHEERAVCTCGWLDFKATLQTVKEVLD